jgi:hypothetical protein
LAELIFLEGSVCFKTFLLTTLTIFFVEFLPPTVALFLTGFAAVLLIAFFLADTAFAVGFAFTDVDALDFEPEVFLAATLGRVVGFLPTVFLLDDFVAIIFYYFRLEIIWQCKIIF